MKRNLIALVLLFLAVLTCGCNQEKNQAVMQMEMLKLKEENVNLKDEIVALHAEKAKLESENVKLLGTKEKFESEYIKLKGEKEKFLKSFNDFESKFHHDHVGIMIPMIFISDPLEREKLSNRAATGAFNGLWDLVENFINEFKNLDERPDVEIKNLEEK